MLSNPVIRRVEVRKDPGRARGAKLKRILPQRVPKAFKIPLGKI